MSAATGTPGAGEPAVNACERGPALPARPAVAIQRATSAARAADRTGATHPAGPAAAEQPRGTAVAAGLTRRTRPAGAAVAEQDAARSAVGPGPSGAVGAVADQRAPYQRLGWLIHRSKRALPHSLQR